MPQKQPNPFFKYSSMAIEMGLVIGVANWCGRKLDAYYHTNSHPYTIVLSLVGISLALYLMLKDFIKPGK